MKFLNKSVVLAVGVLAAGCKGGGGGDPGNYSCAYVPGTVTSDTVSGACTTGCQSSNVEAVADGNQSSFATFAASLGQRTVLTRDNGSGPSFPAGSKAGALITFAGIADVANITLGTLLNGAPQESFSGAALQSESTSGMTPASEYVSFTNTLPFNGMQIIINVAGGSEYQVYEFCGDS